MEIATRSSERPASRLVAVHALQRLPLGLHDAVLLSHLERELQAALQAPSLDDRRP